MWIKTKDDELVNTDYVICFYLALRCKHTPSNGWVVFARVSEGGSIGSNIDLGFHFSDKSRAVEVLNTIQGALEQGVTILRLD